LVRRVSGPNGEFLGVIFAAIKESQLLKFHEATRIGPKSVISLIGLDKRIRYRRSHLGLTGIGKSTAKSQSWKLLEKGPTGQFRQRSVVDGTTRIWSFNRFNRYPLIAMVGTAVSDVQASVANSK
ncbi:MAG: hypothetical protein GWN87_13995, partial [Desulfuromonadales bacterium]|nr:hypothetical protein [Desulfuromonadales bacterium]